MTKTINHASQPAIILFGLTSIGKPKAGAFKITEAEAARKAASKLGLQVLAIEDDNARALATKVPAGRIEGHGEAIVPFVPKGLYAAIETFGRSSRTVATRPSLPISSPRLPSDWKDIKIGDRVLAQDSDPKDGWWQVTVIDKNGDIIKLRWPGSQRGRPFQKHRNMLGLICPSQPNTDESAANKSSAGTQQRFPEDWAAIKINQIVLTKEDGPCEQWWEAKTIKLDKDIFTLQWRDRPDLPTIERPRSCLGLMHPSPKTR